MNRADRLVSEETELGRERDHIRQALKVNGYPDWMLVDSRMSDQWDSVEEEEDGRDGKEEKEVKQRAPATAKSPEGPRVPVTKKKYPVVLPYVRGVLEQLRRVLRPFNIPAYFKPTNTLLQCLVWPKDKVEKGKVVGPVYHITCDDSEATYIGETERVLKTRNTGERVVWGVMCHNIYMWIGQNME